MNRILILIYNITLSSTLGHENEKINKILPIIIDPHKTLAKSFAGLNIYHIDRSEYLCNVINNKKQNIVPSKQTENINNATENPLPQSDEMPNNFSKEIPNDFSNNIK